MRWILQAFTKYEIVRHQVTKVKKFKVKSESSSKNFKLFIEQL